LYIGLLFSTGASESCSRFMLQTQGNSCVSEDRTANRRSSCARRRLAFRSKQRFRIFDV